MNASTTSAPSGSGRRGWILTVLAVTFMFNFLDRQVMARLVTPIKAGVLLCRIALAAYRPAVAAARAREISHIKRRMR